MVWPGQPSEPGSWRDHRSAAPEPEPVGVRGWARARPRVAGYAIAAATTALAVAVVVTGLASTGRAHDPVPPNQAGYLWCCSVHDVSARWVVPLLVHPAAVGAEAVWIGAQTGDGSFFLQVGTNEYVSELTSQYQAFWSDGPLNGMPQDMGSLAPGDVVRARLHHVGRVWLVTFSDVTQRWSHTVDVHYRADASGSLAEWIEEDPVAVDPVGGSRLFRMAETYGTTVSYLLVNGRQPRSDATSSESFADTTGATFIPTSLVHDAFRFRPW